MNPDSQSTPPKVIDGARDGALQIAWTCGWEKQPPQEIFTVEQAVEVVVATIRKIRERIDNLPEGTFFFLQEYIAATDEWIDWFDDEGNEGESFRVRLHPAIREAGLTDSQWREKKGRTA